MLRPGITSILLRVVLQPSSRPTGVGKDVHFAWHKKKFGLELNASTWKTWWHKRVELLQQAEDLSVYEAKAAKRIKAHGTIIKLSDALFK